MDQTLDQSQLLDVRHDSFDMSPSVRRRTFFGAASASRACCALCSRAYDALDSVLPQSIYRLQVLRIVLAVILGLLLVAVPIIMQQIEPPGVSFTLFLFLYVTWAVVQNKLVRLSLEPEPELPEPNEVNRTWAAMQYFQLDQTTPGGPSSVTFNTWTVRRETDGLRHPDVEMMHQEGVQMMPQLEPITSCACCYNDFSPASAVALLQCGHVFCQDCIAHWALSGRANSGTCPVCRHDFSAA
eukprot:symbB.v1.2.020902.t1/scaffold1783.1/size101483/3